MFASEFNVMLIDFELRGNLPILGHHFRYLQPLGLVVWGYFSGGSVDNICVDFVKLGVV